MTDNLFANQSSLSESGFKAALERLQCHAKIGTPNSIYIYDLVTHHTSCCSQYSVPALLGYSDRHIDGLGPLGLAKIIYPADVQAVALHFQQLNTLASWEVISIEYRMQGANGKWCLLRSHDTSLHWSEEGFPLQVLSLVEDVTSAQQSEIELMMAAPTIL